jgi:hypothetical protein
MGRTCTKARAGALDAAADPISATPWPAPPTVTWTSLRTCKAFGPNTIRGIFGSCVGEGTRRGSHDDDMPPGGCRGRGHGSEPHMLSGIAAVGFNHRRTLVG